jgi:hypothetical protein
LLNTNGNTEGIFSSVNFRGILPTELPWEKNLKQSKKKKDDVSFLPTELPMEIPTEFSVGISVGKL